MYNKFFNTGTEIKPEKNFLMDNRAQRLLISILDGSFEKQIQTTGTSSKTGIADTVYLNIATFTNYLGYASKRQTVDAVKAVSAESIQSLINVIEVLEIHQGLIPETHQATFNREMTILTALLKIEQAGFAKVRGDNLDANDAYTAKLIEIIRVLILEKEMVPSDEDLTIMKELGGAFIEFMPQIEEVNTLPEPMPELENKTSADELEQAVNQIIAKVKTLEIERSSEPEEKQEQIVMPRNYFRLWDKIQDALKNQNSAMLSLGLQNLTENFEFKLYAKALISVANDFNPSQSLVIKQKLLDLKVVIEEMLKQMSLAEEQIKPQNL